MKFNFGESVISASAYSKSIHGARDIVKPEFEGVVTYSFMAGNGENYYHVRDDNGEYWQRKERELRKPANDSLLYVGSSAD